MKKKIQHLILGLAAVLLASSCSDFLEKSPLNSVDPETNVTDDVVQPAHLDVGHCGGQ